VRPRKQTSILTIAALREPARRGRTECLFNEREQIFQLPAAANVRAEMAAQLKEALKQRLPVKVVLAPRTGIVERIETPAPRELSKFELRPLVENPERPIRVNVSSLDPTTFNIVGGHHLNVGVFGFCRRIVPNYKTAKDIFDFCAVQSCNLPGPPTIAPCIPFQYVRDGCFARAHKMRQIIEGRYGYCCEKVFSFANQNMDRLAVRANKWGGCCVTWWYHVAPLVRVRIQLRLEAVSLGFVVALVIDPGMFDKPVLLSTWLTAQEEAACSANAKVSMCSIQPGSAYQPANYQGTAFSTDPAYTDTDATLIADRNLTTC
jgi:hypothetical protein